MPFALVFGRGSIAESHYIEHGDFLHPTDEFSTECVFTSVDELRAKSNPRTVEQFRIVEVELTGGPTRRTGTIAIRLLRMVETT